MIIIVLIIDCTLHSHLLTPMFGEIAPGVRTTCGANRLYADYVYFYNNIWPTITILTVTILPGGSMLFFILAIAINVRKSRNRVTAVEQPAQQHEQRRARFLHRQMLILMLMTVILFFFTTFPVAIYHFTLSTLGVQQPFALSLLLVSILSLITTANYALNFYLHCLTSKLFRKEFFKVLPCSISITFGRRNISATQQNLTHPPREGTITKLMGRASNANALGKTHNTLV